MSKDRFRLDDYIQHISVAIDKIGIYTVDGRDSFLQSTLHQDAVIRNLEIVGEASKKIMLEFPEFLEANPAIALKSATAMRNVLSHAYFNVDLDVLWDTIQSDLGQLRDDLQAANKLGTD